MKISKKLYVTNRKDWRAWLKKNHKDTKEIWLVYSKKETGKPRVPYDEAVEEALCFGWIDSTIKTIDKKSFAQRFSPRKSTGTWSQPNIERMRRLKKQGKMTVAGIAVFKRVATKQKPKKESLAPDIRRALKKDAQAWKNFQKFPAAYKRVRIAYLESRRKHGAPAFKRSLSYFIKKTHANKQFAFGGVQKD